MTLALASAGVQAEVAAAYAVILHAQQISVTVVVGNLMLLREGLSILELQTAALSAEAA